MAKNILIEFDNKKAKGGAKGLTAAAKLFEKAGMKPTDFSAEDQTRRTGGRSYRKVNFMFADSQRVEMWVSFNKASPEKSGGIFKVKLGGSGVAQKARTTELPIKAQDNHAEAIKEIVSALTAKAKTFQVQLAKLKTPMPPRMSTPRVKQEIMLKEKIQGLDQAIADVDAEIEVLNNSSKIDNIGDSEINDGAQMEKLSIEDIIGSSVYKLITNNEKMESLSLSTEDLKKELIRLHGEDDNMDDYQMHYDELEDRLGRSEMIKYCNSVGI